MISYPLLWKVAAYGCPCARKSTIVGTKCVSAPIRTVPLIYIKDGDRYVIAAAYAGSDTNPTWWLNLQASGEAVIQIKRQTIPVRAQLATDAEKAALWPQLVAMYPYFTGYQERTQRPIPVIFLTPTSPAPS